MQLIIFWPMDGVCIYIMPSMGLDVSASALGVFAHELSVARRLSCLFSDHQ